MITIKDIAKAAGVSHATVSNVFNRKGNVSAEKVKLVLDKAKEMGYRINEAASSLRSGSARILAVIVPDICSVSYSDLFTSLCHVASDNAYGIMLRITDNIPAREESALQDVLSSRAECVVVVSSFPSPKEAYAPLVQSGARVQFVLRGGLSGTDSIGFDMRAAATDIAHAIMRVQPRGTVGLMTSMLLYDNERIFRDALEDALPDHDIVLMESIVTQYEKHALSFLAAHRPSVVVATCEEMASAILHASALLGIAPPRVFALSALRCMPPADYAAYRLDYRLLGKTVGNMLLKKQPVQKTEIAADGFAPVAAPSPGIVRGTRLCMLSIHNPFTSALRSLLPLLEKETGIVLTIDTMPGKELTQRLSQNDVPNGVDLLRMDVALMDHCAEQLLKPLDGLACMEALRGEYSNVGEQSYAMAFDPSCHLLFFRQDLFESPRYQRAYHEKHQRSLTLPENYAEYAHIAAFFDAYAAETHARGALVGQPVSECIATLLTLSEESSRPRLRLSLSALEQYVDIRRRVEASATIAEDGNWNGTFDRFAMGEAAMMIAYSNYAERLSHNPLLQMKGRVGYAKVPGGTPMLGGGVLGISKTSEQDAACYAFFQWLKSEQTAHLMALLGGCSPAEHPYECTSVLDVYPWLRMTRQGFSSGIRRGMFAGVRKEAGHQLALERRIAAICMRMVAGEIEPAVALHEIAQIDASLVAR